MSVLQENISRPATNYALRLQARHWRDVSQPHFQKVHGGCSRVGEGQFKETLGGGKATPQSLHSNVQGMRASTSFARQSSFVKWRQRRCKFEGWRLIAICHLHVTLQRAGPFGDARMSIPRGTSVVSNVPRRNPTPSRTWPLSPSADCTCTSSSSSREGERLVPSMR